MLTCLCLRFAIGDTHYQFVALSFGLVSALSGVYQGLGPGPGLAETMGDRCDVLPG